MEKFYKTPEMDITAFECDDVILNSNWNAESDEPQEDVGV